MDIGATRYAFGRVDLVEAKGGSAWTAEHAAIEINLNTDGSGHWTCTASLMTPGGDLRTLCKLDDYATSPAVLLEKVRGRLILLEAALRDLLIE